MQRTRVNTTQSRFDISSLSVLRRMEAWFERMVWRFGGFGIAIIITFAAIGVVYGVPRIASVADRVPNPGNLPVAIGDDGDGEQASVEGPVVDPCPDISEVSAMVQAPLSTFGEPCGFHWSGDQLDANCPAGYLCTFSLDQRFVVVRGNGDSMRIFGAGTWRYVPGYPLDHLVRDPCALLAFEREYARQHHPNVPVDAVGFEC